ncbi:hypothetical protein HDV04_001643 [Boothiomyces sp. JEL0838]|nr:hypothetical protein HDV04_001643 [Boothiomyces sp. JEL0838]
MQYYYQCPSPYAIKARNSFHQLDELRDNQPEEPIAIQVQIGNEKGFQLQSKWEPIKDRMDDGWKSHLSFQFKDCLISRLRFDKERVCFKLAEKVDSKACFLKEFPVFDIYYCISAADFCYRTLCFFPGINVNSEGPGGYKCCWSANLMHKESGFGLALSEFKGGASIRYYFGDEPQTWDCIPIDQLKTLKYVSDIVELLNAFLDHETFYHPAAVIVNQPNLERYITEPKLFNDRSKEYPFQKTIVGKFKPVSLLSEAIEGMMPFEYSYGKKTLGFVIPSSLLFYALLSFYTISDVKPVGQATIKGVWSVCLQHRETGVTVILMDENGLASARIENDQVNEACKQDLKNMLDWICSGRSLHPYDGLANGSIA